MSSRVPPLRWVAPFARRYRRRLGLLAALSAIEIGLRALSPWALAMVVDHALMGATLTSGWRAVMAAIGASGGRRDVLIAFMMIGLVLQVAHQVVVMVHGRVSVTVGQAMIRDLREQQFGHLQALSLAQHTRLPTGEALQRLEGDARCVEHLVLRGLFPLVFSGLTLIVMVGVLLTIDVPLAVLTLAIIPPLYLWLRTYARRMAPRADLARRTDSRLSSRVVESFASIRLIKSHAREDHEQARFASVAHDVARAWTTVGRMSAMFAIVNGILTVVGSSVILLVGGLAVLDGRISVGTLLLVLAYVGYVYGPLSAIAHTTGDLQHAFASARRVTAALALAPEPADAPGALRADGIRGEVEFDDVAFAYGDGPRVLDGVSLRAHPGDVIALVGPSGAGKSTLAGLLLRFFEVAAGEIRIDGAPVSRYQLRSLRQQVGIVLQEAVVLTGTVRENLRYGRLTATDAEIEGAARAAQAHEFICALPDGYDTELGDGGAQLSGGQRQRLSIARAFLKDAPILILDEPTAALDTLAEAQVVAAVRRLCAGRTTFVVAHRLSTVRDATRILVLDRGRIVGAGTHDELRRDSVLYRQLAAQLADPVAVHDARIAG